MGEIAAAHALSDIVAKGGRPDHALAVAVLPQASSRQSEDDLFQLLAGARAVFDREGVALVGGHSSEGNELSIGFFVSGAVARERVLRKGGLAPGDRLILTKPLGPGIMLAAWMRGRIKARALSVGLACMRETNSKAAAVMAAHGPSAQTDITGFGLAGHLLEMLQASGLAATLSNRHVSLLPGVAALAAQGIGSTLLPENLAQADLVAGPAVTAATLAILFDPQTSGGLLAGVPATQAKACLQALWAADIPAAEIGVVSTRLRDSSAILHVSESLDMLAEMPRTDQTRL
jgi:selenide,water dikinase